MAKLIDANLIIRFLLNDSPKQAEAVKKLFESPKNLILTDLTLAEVIWVLTSVYKFTKAEVVEKVQTLLNLKIFSCNLQLLTSSLKIFQKYNISYADAYLVAYSKLNNLELYSFDKGLDKVPIARRREP